MKYKQQVLVLLALLCSMAGFGQYEHQRISLKVVTDSVLARYPVSHQRDDIKQLQSIKDQQLRNANLPVLSLSGQMTIQSDVTALPISLPNMTIPELAKDWYKVNLDLSQLIYDGGQLKQQRAMEEMSSAIKEREVGVQEQTLREHVAKLFFRAILLKRQMQIYESVKRGLRATSEEMSQGVASGAVLETSQKSLQAELLRTHQQQLESEGALHATLAQIAVLSGIELQASDSLVAPFLDASTDTLQTNRAEWWLMQQQKELLNSQLQLIKARRMPVVMAFAQAGYGRPGLNMLDDDFADYYMAGIKFSYKLWDWKSNQREQQMNRLSLHMVDQSVQAYELNQQALFKAKQAEVVQLTKVVESDNEIVALQTDVVHSQRIALNQGVLTAAAYVIEHEKLTRALLAREINLIRLLNSRLELQFINGNFDYNE